MTFGWIVFVKKLVTLFTYLGFDKKKKKGSSQSLSSWWLVPQPLWKICEPSSNWIMKPQGSGWKFQKICELPPPIVIFWWLVLVLTNFGSFFFTRHTCDSDLSFLSWRLWPGMVRLNEPQGNRGRWKGVCVGPGLFPNDPPAGTIWKGAIPTYTSEHWHEFIYLSTDFAVIELHHFIEIWDRYSFSKGNLEAICLFAHSLHHASLCLSFLLIYWSPILYP